MFLAFFCPNIYIYNISCLTVKFHLSNSILFSKVFFKDLLNNIGHRQLPIWVEWGLERFDIDIFDSFKNSVIFYFTGCYFFSNRSSLLRMFTVFFWSLWNSTRTHFNFVYFLYSNNIGYYMQIVFVLIVILNNFLIYFMTTRIIHEVSTYRYIYLVKPQDLVGVWNS